MKNPMTTSGNRTRDFPICTAVPQPNAPRITTSVSTNVKVQKVYVRSNTARGIHRKHRIAATVYHRNVVCSRYIVVNTNAPHYSCSPVSIIPPTPHTTPVPPVSIIPPTPHTTPVPPVSIIPPKLRIHLLIYYGHFIILQNDDLVKQPTL